MSQTWSIFTAVTVLAVQTLGDSGNKSCNIWSSAGSVVQRESSFKVYCTFKCKCKGSMYSGHPPTPQIHEVFNSTTIYYEVVNITEILTYSCQCNCPSAEGYCGVDVRAGYPPDRPKNISCIYKVTNNESGVAVCTWNRGRGTFLRNHSQLWVRTISGNHTVTKSHSVSSKGTDSQSASFTLSRSVQLISVWVRVQNELGSAVSVTINYTLSDIAMPPTPDLGQPECSSRECIIQVYQTVRTQHLEIQYRSEAQTWTSHPDSVVQMGWVQMRSISSLEPYRLYHFRARSKFSTGLWSQWSTNVSSMTKEEAPSKELDVWYAEPAPDSKSLRVYWKGANISWARGKIIAYRVEVDSPDSGLVFSANISADASNCSVQFCAKCQVTVWACNSKGLSPPARITTHQTKAKPLKVVQEIAGNHSVAISWGKDITAPPHAGYVVEWYPEGHKLEELRWIRLSRNHHRAVITAIEPFECYEGAVNVVYDDRSVSRTRFTGVKILESAPAACPSVQEPEVVGDQVKVTWQEIPRGLRGGCITSYTIYLENSSRDRQLYSVPASKRTHTIKDLSSALYSLWVTASTAGGECRMGPKVKRFYIQQETPIFLLVVCGVLSLIVMCLVSLCHSSAAKQRLWVFFQCIMLDDVPDPANSKWAKECTQEKGKMNLQLQLSICSRTEEEEPILVDVEELPKPSSDIRAPTDASSQLPPQTSLSPFTEPTTVLSPLTNYIKSFSHDSDSSDHTQTSLDTNTTVDYISSHSLGTMDEEDQEEEEGEEEEMLDFLPSHNIIIGPLGFGGKLTLDAVKINCNDFL